MSNPPFPPPPPPPPPFMPPPLPPEGGTSFRALASYSWLSIPITLVVSFSLNASSQGQAHGTVSGSAIAAGILMITGLLAGVIALFAIPKHGRKGLLAPALAGICIWLALTAIAIPSFFLARNIALKVRAQGEQFKKTPPTHLADAVRVEDAALGYSFDLPPGFKAVPAAQTPKDFHAIYMKRGADGTAAAVLIKYLGTPLSPYRRMTAANLPPGKNMTLVPFTWRGLDVTAVRLPEKNAQGEFVTFNVQIPLKQQAIQIGFGGISTNEAQSHALAEQVLPTLDGPVNW